MSWPLFVLLACPTACTSPLDPPKGQGDVIIGGHRYRLPDEAFADGLVDHGPQDQLLLELPVPVKAGAGPATVQLLLTAPRVPAEHGPAQRVFDYIRVDAQIRATGDVQRSDFVFRQAPSRVSDAPPHLVQVITAIPLGGRKFDVAVGPSVTDVQEFVACSYPVGELPGLYCDQEFAAPGVAIKASYDRAYSRYSYQIRTFVLSYLKRHEVKS